MSAVPNFKTSASVKTSIKTTGQLRDFLVTMMIGVKNGDLSEDRASRITKLAQQVNESMYAEIKTARVRHEFGEAVVKLGEMPIGETAA